SWDTLLLEGTWTARLEVQLRECMHSNELFVAEQVGIPALYESLWQLSGGPTPDDHGFHEISTIRPATDEEVDSLVLWGTVVDLCQRFRRVKNKWNPALSPHGTLTG